MQNAGVALGAPLNFAAGIDHRQRRAVTDRHSVQKTDAFCEKFKDMSQGQETEKDIVGLDDDGVAVGFQGGNYVFVRKYNAFRYAGRAGRIHDDGRVTALRRCRDCRGCAADFNYFRKWNKTYAFLSIETLC